jgi:hypothetical protein
MSTKYQDTFWLVLLQQRRTKVSQKVGKRSFGACVYDDGMWEGGGGFREGEERRAMAEEERGYTAGI